MKKQMLRAQVFHKYPVLCQTSVVEMGGRIQKYIKSPNPKIKNQNTKIQDPESKTYS